MPSGDPFELDTRREIYTFLQEIPGSHFSELQRRLDLATGTLQYHLQVLEDRDLVEAKKDGRYTRYYPSFEVDRRDKKVLGLLRQETPRSILLDLLEHGSSRLTKISDRLELAPSTVSFHMDKLREAEVVHKPKRGVYELGDPDRVQDIVVSYQESFVDSAVDRIVSLFTGVRHGRPVEPDEDEAGDG